MEELTEAQTKELHNDLLALIKELEDALALSIDGTKPVDLDGSIGRVTRMDAMQQQSMAKANRRNHETRLQMARQALERIKAGEYGYCRDCEEPIGVRRLKARPESAFCIRCQDALSKR